MPSTRPSGSPQATLPSRHRVPAAALVLAGALFAPITVGSAHAQAWPAKPVRLILPYGPGGGSDVVARPLGHHLSQRETAAVLQRSGLSPLGPVAVNTMAPDEGNMFLLGKVATPQQQEKQPKDFP